MKHNNFIIKNNTDTECNNLSCMLEFKVDVNNVVLLNILRKNGIL